MSSEVSANEVTALAWHNGKIVCRETAAPSIASISLHMGTGVFDGLMAYWNRDHYYLHEVRAHLERFQKGAVKMGLELPWSVAQMEVGIIELLERSPRATRYIRPIVFRGAPELMLTGSDRLPVDVCIFGVAVQRDRDEPVRCQWSTIERVASEAMPVAWKVCGVYVNSYQVRRSAEVAGFDDGIMLDRRGKIAEASAANVFFIRGTRLVTPIAGRDVFSGITRANIVQMAPILGLSCEERDLQPEDLAGFEGAFLCSTLMEVRPISLLGERRLATVELPTFRKVLLGFRAVTHA